MTMLSKHHEVLVDGKGRCSVPMWCNGLPAGFCDMDAYGPKEKGQDRYDGYVPALACFYHGGPPKPKEKVTEE